MSWKSLRARTAIAVTAAVLCATALPGCGGEVEAGPKRLPTLPAVPASDGGEDDATVVAGPPPPDPSAYPGKDERTDEGAEQAFRFYIATLIWSEQSGSDDLHSSLYEPSCSVCKDNSAQIRNNGSLKHHWGSAVIEDVRLGAASSERFDVEVEYLFSLSAHTEFDDAGEEVSVPRTEYLAKGGMRWVDDAWLVGGLGMRWSENEHG